MSVRNAHLPPTLKTIIELFMNKKNLLILILIPLFIIVGIILYFTFKEPGDISNNNQSDLYGYYENESLGLSFRYPREFSIPKEELLVKEKNQEVYSGEGLRISFGEDIDAFSIFLVSSDFEMFKSELYRTQKDRDIICPKFDIFNSKKNNFCRDITIASRNGIEEFYAEVDEGVVFVGRALYLDMNNEKYSALTISQSFSELNEVLQQYINSESELKLNIEEIIKNLVARKNLPEKTKKQMEELDEVLRSIRLEG